MHALHCATPHQVRILLNAGECRRPGRQAPRVAADGRLFCSKLACDNLDMAQTVEDLLKCSHFLRFGTGVSASSASATTDQQQSDIDSKLSMYA